MPLNQLRVEINTTMHDFNLDVNLEISTSGVTTIFGHSGSGKTTLLRCIAGLYKAHNTSIIFNSTTWQNNETFLPTHKRSIGYVFQESSLLQHLSAQKNLEYAYKRAPLPVNQEEIEQLTELFNLRKILKKNFHQISGGERQRVAIAMALLSKPKLLLMDEPLASLDSAHKEEIIKYLIKVKEEFQLPILYVSHSLEEVIHLSDHMVILKEGKALFNGSASTGFDFLNINKSNERETSVIIEGPIIDVAPQWELVTIAWGNQHIRFHANKLINKSFVRLRIKASDVSLSLTHHLDTSFLNIICATIDDIKELKNSPGKTLVKLKIDDHILYAYITSLSVQRMKLKHNQMVWAQIKAVAMI